MSFGNYELENYIIMEMVRNIDIIPDVMDKLDPDDLYNPLNQKLYTIIVDKYTKGDSIDLLQLSELDIFGSDVEGMEYITKISDYHLYGANLSDYINKVKAKSFLRKLYTSTVNIQKKIHESSVDDNCDIKNLKAECQTMLDIELLENKNKSLRDLITNTLELISSRCERDKSKYKDKYKYGYPWLDYMTAGVHKGEVTILGATPGTGKTAFALNIASNLIAKDNHVVIFSIEMSEENLIERMLITMTGIDGKKTRSGKLDEIDFRALFESAGDLQETNLNIYQDNTIEDIRLRCRKLKNKNELDYVIIDYLQLLDTSKKYANENIKYSNISRDIKILANDMQVPILLVSQLNRGVHQRSERKPRKSDLRDSGAIEQNADNILFLWEKADENNSNLNEKTIMLTVDKQRNGLAGVDKEMIFIKNNLKLIEKR